MTNGDRIVFVRNKIELFERCDELEIGKVYTVKEVYDVDYLVDGYTIPYIDIYESTFSFPMEYFELLKENRRKKLKKLIS